MYATAYLTTVMLLGAAVTTQQHAIDTKHSVMRVRVYKAGALSALGHDHVIAAPIAAGKVDLEGKHVDLHVNAHALTVQDPKASEKDRGEIQKAMLGAEVLDVDAHPQIEFRSTAAEPAGSSAWKVNGNLTLHGATHPVTVEVSEKEGHYVGHSLFRLSEFGIKPPAKAGGAVRAKDEVRIEFDIVLAQ